jgi:fibronectin-binding autotransporter adhesin
LRGANTFTGTTQVMAGTLWFNTAGANAVKGNVVLHATPTQQDPRGTWLLTTASNQFGPNSHLNFTATATADYALSAMNAAVVLEGQTQTVAGLNCTTGNAVIENTDTVWRPRGYQNAGSFGNGTLIVNTAAGDDSFFNGLLTDVDFSYYEGNNHSAATTLGLTKTGDGKLTLDGCNVYKNYNTTPILVTANDYTGPTTITGGELALNAGGQVSPTVVNDALFTINAGDHTVSTINGAGITQVLTGSLTATSIVQDTLIIGGGSAAAAVPEPCTLVLLVLAGMGALLAWRRK